MGLEVRGRGTAWLFSQSGQDDDVCDSKDARDYVPKRCVGFCVGGARVFVCGCMCEYM